MPVEYVYQGRNFGKGFQTILPRENDFIYTQGFIYKVKAVMFNNTRSGDVIAIIYLKESTLEEEHMLKNYGGLEI